MMAEDQPLHSLSLPAPFRPEQLAAAFAEPPDKKFAYGNHIYVETACPATIAPIKRHQEPCSYRDLSEALSCVNEQVSRQLAVVNDTEPLPSSMFERLAVHALKGHRAKAEAGASLRYNVNVHGYCGHEHRATVALWSGKRTCETLQARDRLPLCYALHMSPRLLARDNACPSSTSAF